MFWFFFFSVSVSLWKTECVCEHQSNHVCWKSAPGVQPLCLSADPADLKPAGARVEGLCCSTGWTQHLAGDVCQLPPESRSGTGMQKINYTSDIIVIHVCIIDAHFFFSICAKRLFLADVNALLAALLESIRISACIYKVVSSYIHLVHAVQTIIGACSIWSVM